MEQFYQQPGSLSTTISFLRGLAFIDLFASAAYLYLLLIWADMSQTFAFIALFQILHLFSWMAGIASTSGMYAHEYILMTSMVYIIAFFADLGSLIWRSIILDSSDRFQMGALIFNYIFCVNDLVIVFLLGNFLTQARKFRDAIMVALEAAVDTELLVGQYKRIDFRLYSARNYVRILSILDLFLFLGVVLLFALGLSVTQTFGMITFMQIPHAYLWIAGLAIDRGMLDWGFVVIFCIHYGIAILLDFSSLIWRALIVADCVNCSFFSIFGWITVGLVGALTVVSFAQLFLGITVVRMLVIEFKRLLPLVIDKLYPTSQRFYSPR